KIKIWNNQQSVIDTGQKREAGKIKNIYPVQSTGRIFRAGEEPGLQKNVREIMSELYALVGLFSVKKLIEEIYAFVEIQKLRCKEKLVTEPLVLHMIFKGNPGTGKTTVARILGKLFKEVGVLPRGHMIEVERADLVGEFIGHTAHKTREQVKKALGGILFIDEAYSLARGGEKDFGKEAIDALVKGMEDYRGNLILILAGYQDEMNWFIETNPGIRSRFPIHITFSDYRIDELLDIADLMLKQRQYVLSEEARKYLRFLIDKEHRRHEHSGNARLVRNLIERAMRRQAVRLIRQNHDLTRNELMMITGEDLERDIL
ncbi:MAG: ATPase, partial [Pelotomaculum thermopropionicum]